MDDLIDRRPVLRARATVRAKIKEKREVAKGTLLVVFDLLGERFDYRAGQYFWVELLDPPYQDGKGPRRHISAVTSPTEHGVIGLCTRVRDSAFETLARRASGRRGLEVEPPRGKFVLPDDASRPLVFVAGRIGITAFRSMLRYIQGEGPPGGPRPAYGTERGCHAHRPACQRRVLATENCRMHSAEVNTKLTVCKAT